MKITSSKFLLLSLILLILAPFFNLEAQTAPENYSDIKIYLSPENPKPGSQVNVTLESSLTDLNRSKVTWSINGVEKRSEVGLKRYTLQAGSAGVPMTISVNVQDQNNNTQNKELTFTPAGVDLIFETISYVPPFYKGKAMNVNQGSVVVVAFPEIYDTNGRKYQTKDLIYNWKKDGTAAANVSGAGKNYFTYTGSVPIREVRIEVKVSSPDQSTIAENWVNIPLGNPKIVFYENSPIYGFMTNRAIKDTVQMLTDEFSVIAAPYFFSAGYATTPNLDYAWSLNGQTVGTQDPKNSFTVRQEKEGSGTANIGLKVSGVARIFQFADKNFTINFQKQ
jgi:hypothetical protein